MDDDELHFPGRPSPDPDSLLSVKRARPWPWPAAPQLLAARSLGCFWLAHGTPHPPWCDGGKASEFSKVRHVPWCSNLSGFTQSARRTPMQHRAGTITIFCLWLRSSIGGVTRLPLQPAHTERERCVERNVEKVLDSSNYWVACTGLAGRAQPLRLRHHGWVGEQRIGSLADSPQRLRSPNRAPGSQPH
jgi:hypothetical protein